ncbi:glycosyltransferase [Paracoccus sp. IB05]|uniref:glycosyltransferase n=1 Tax=Paracoccus sp. IB05 TaxID=2779367 RepID=UPI0018E8CA8C|nr:glycosyltransferase [Paracoccus sp. IB05]MBJ2152692.1 glycosyltransferase [Paracoccus sp. IB05]
MKAAFFVDHIFREKEDGTVFTMGGKFPTIGWRSYLQEFSEMAVVSRVLPLPSDSKERLGISSAPGIKFIGTSPRRGWRRLLDHNASEAIVRRQVENADVVIVRLPSQLGLTASKIARRMNKPLLVELVACPWDSLYFHGSILARAYAPVLALRTRVATRNAPVVRYVTRQFLQGRYPTSGKEFVASNVELHDSAAINTRRDLSKRKIVFGTIGSLNTRLKGIHIAIEALSQLKTLRPELSFEYRILGEGDRAQFNGSAIADYLKFDGVLPGGKPVLDWLDHVDIYLQPSFQEGLPRALIEAISRGCLCLGSTAGGIPELLAAERLHKPGDVKQLLASLQSLLSLSIEEQIAESRANIMKSKDYHSDRLLAIRRSSIREIALLGNLNDR